MGYVKGQIVEYVPIDARALSVPLPQRWYILQVAPGRDGKVLKAFERCGYSCHSPTVVRTVMRSRDREARRPHLGRLTIKRMLPGLIFIPDFELDNIGAMRSVDDVEDLLFVGPCVAMLSAADWLLLRQVEACYSVPLSQRKYALHQLVRITEGPLAHFVGQIERLDSKGRLKVFIDAVMRGVSVEVNETQVEPVVVRKRAKTDRRRARALAPT